jgi:hypothetical protein
MSFRGFPNVPPQTLIDSTSWRVPFAPVYSPPSLDLPAEDLAKYQTRLRSGDTTAANEWRRRVESTERRYKVPDTLRSVWRRDSVPGSRAASVAFTRSVVSARFEIDLVRLGIYLLAVAVLTGLAMVFSPRLGKDRK